MTPVLIAAAALAPPARCEALIGFVENWPGTSLQGWQGGSDLVNPGIGGVDGIADGFLLVSTPFPTHLGTYSIGPEYAGDWLAAGITEIRLWLDDVNDAQPLEIHVSIGNQFNLWQYNEGFIPPHDAWKEFTVDLSSSANFTRIIGSATFQQALQRVDRVHVRHDTAPFTQAPDPIQGDFGIDRLQLMSDAVPVAVSSWGRLKVLYR